MTTKKIVIEHKDLGEATIIESAFSVWRKRGWHRKRGHAGQAGVVETPPFDTESTPPAVHETASAPLHEPHKAPAKKAAAKKGARKA